MHPRAFARQLRQQMTDAERLLWRQLRAHRLNGAKFRRQQPLGPYIVDFIDPAARLIIEADGGQHNDSPTDPTRDTWLTAQGYRVLRFWNHEILTQTESVMTAILQALEQTEHPLPPRGGGAGERGKNLSVTSSSQHKPTPCMFSFSEIFEKMTEGCGA